MNSGCVYIFYYSTFFLRFLLAKKIFSLKMMYLHVDISMCFRYA
jgi:hypothetical protein